MFKIYSWDVQAYGTSDSANICLCRADQIFKSSRQIAINAPEVVLTIDFTTD